MTCTQKTIQLNAQEIAALAKQLSREDLADGQENLLEYAGKPVFISDDAARTFLKEKSATPGSTSLSLFSCDSISLQKLKGHIQRDAYLRQFFAALSSQNLSLNDLISLVRIATLAKFDFKNAKKADDRRLFLTSLMRSKQQGALSKSALALENMKGREIRYFLKGDQSATKTRPVNLVDMALQIAAIVAARRSVTLFEKNVPLVRSAAFPEEVRDQSDLVRFLVEGKILVAYEPKALQGESASGGYDQRLGCIFVGEDAKKLLFREGSSVSVEEILLHELTHGGQDDRKAWLPIADAEARSHFADALFLVMDVGAKEARAVMLNSGNPVTDPKVKANMSVLERLLGKAFAERFRNEYARVPSHFDEAVSMAEEALSAAKEGRDVSIDMGLLSKRYAEYRALLTFVLMLDEKTTAELKTAVVNHEGIQIPWTTFSVVDGTVAPLSKNVVLPRDYASCEASLRQSLALLEQIGSIFVAQRQSPPGMYYKPYEAMKLQAFTYFLYRGAMDPTFDALAFFQSVLIPISTWEWRNTSFGYDGIQ